jgi:Protein of unknown function/Domain of unknown function (DUF1835)
LAQQTWIQPVEVGAEFWKGQSFFRRGSAMTQTTAHFVFTPSGAGCLVQALRKAGRHDLVVASFDNLSFGPIDPPDSSLRAKWVENELGNTEWHEHAADSERDWNETRFPGHRKVAWLTRRSAMEYAGFLEWLWRLGDAPCEVVDLTEVNVSYPERDPPRPPRLAVSLGMLHHDKICSDKLWDLAEPLQGTARARYREFWRQLRSENAPLRVIDGDSLVSAPISFFDSLLMSYVTKDWQKVGRVVAPAMVACVDDDIVQTGDMFLAARINSLAQNGRLEIRGKSALEIFHSEVRLPAARG